MPLLRKSMFAKALQLQVLSRCASRATMADWPHEQGWAHAAKAHGGHLTAASEGAPSMAESVRVDRLGGCRFAVPLTLLCERIFTDSTAPGRGQGVMCSQRARV
eukprot:15225985-Alexandrium_andersonii.AAC.1